MNRRRWGIPLVFLWALAQGIWIGASWHAGAAAVASGRSTSVHTCACNPVKTHSTQITAQAAYHTCLICDLGNIAPDVPAAALPAELLPFSRSMHSPQSEKSISVLSYNLSKGRAPPVSA